MSSFQGVKLEGFRSILISGSTRGVPLCTEVSSFQGTVYRGGVLISGGWNRGVLLYTVVFLLQGVGIEGPQFRGLE